MKKVLITGASGFVGTYLAQHLLELGNTEIYGTYLTDESKEKSSVKDKITFHKADLQDKNKINEFIKLVMQEIIYHKAAIISVPASFKHPIGKMYSKINYQLHV